MHFVQVILQWEAAMKKFVLEIVDYVNSISWLKMVVQLFLLKLKMNMVVMIKLMLIGVEV